MTCPDTEIEMTDSGSDTWRPQATDIAAQVTAGRWAIDATRSTLRVSVRVGVLATARGTFADVVGHVDFAVDPTASRVEVSVGTSSLSSGSACLDSLLHGAGVIDSAANPTIGFVSRALRPRPAGGWFLDGLLATDSAVLDVTLDMTDPVRQDGAFLFRAKGRLPSREAVRLLSHPGVERVLGKTMELDLTVVAVPGPANRSRS